MSSNSLIESKVYKRRKTFQRTLIVTAISVALTAAQPLSSALAKPAPDMAASDLIEAPAHTASLANLIEAVKPAVVNIAAKKVETNNSVLVIPIPHEQVIGSSLSAIHSVSVARRPRASSRHVAVTFSQVRSTILSRSMHRSTEAIRGGHCSILPAGSSESIPRSILRTVAMSVSVLPSRLRSRNPWWHSCGNMDTSSEDGLAYRSNR